jgi:hypothetical protein
LVLPAILNPYIQEAPAAVMTRIALDWIIDGTPLDELFDEVAGDQYTRELTLTHFVQVMLDVASGFRPSPRAAYMRRDLQLVASLSAFYRKLRGYPVIAFRFSLGYLKGTGFFVRSGFKSLSIR